MMAAVVALPRCGIGHKNTSIFLFRTADFRRTNAGNGSLDRPMAPVVGGQYNTASTKKKVHSAFFMVLKKKQTAGPVKSCCLFLHHSAHFSCVRLSLCPRRNLIFRHNHLGIIGVCLSQGLRRRLSIFPFQEILILVRGRMVHLYRRPSIPSFHQRGTAGLPPPLFGQQRS